eukprot:159196-Prorocentrum_minimum.AAC.2
MPSPSLRRRLAFLSAREPSLATTQLRGVQPANWPSSLDLVRTGAQTPTVTRTWTCTRTSARTSPAPLSPESANGYRYIIVFIDKSSGFSHIFFMRRKSEAVDMRVPR